MAANDYYNPSSRQQTPQPAYNYQSYNSPAPQDYRPPISSAPSYHSQAPSRPGTVPPRQPDITSPISPFEAPFDDHVYPMSSQAPHRFDSETSLGQDTRYYGQGGGGGLEPSNSYQDDIPLRDHPGLKAQDSTDHVYDAPIAPARLEEGRGNKRMSGMGMFKTKGRIPWVTYILTTIQVAVFIAEIVKNAQLTGSPIEIHPSFNPMIGPSPYVLINMGARYVPCMHSVDGIQNRASGGAISWPCPNTTSSDVVDCQLNNLCGFNMPASENPIYPGNATEPLQDFSNQPDQWFRFIIPIFLHAGIIHIGFNMLLQMTLGKEMEIAIGPIRYFLVYICSGIFGFVLGGNFAATGIASTGASGALFGIIALNLLDLLYTWGERRSPWKDFAFIMLDVVISFVLGLLPGLDNFSHIGGFFMGLVLGICILHSPNALRKRIEEDAPPYTPVAQIKASDGDRPNSGVTGFVKNPVGFFKGRKPAWWAWWLVRVGSLVFVLIVFILLLKNFYAYRKTCSWCKYLSCINVNNWCNIGNLQLTQVNTTNKRSVFDSWEAMAKLYEA
ncbi:rhomboid family membrane protein-like protein [Mollisia scopiformis]|uniref:Rhomboid-type serine protease n=1 Tax=Mollisia scopiformis TaxID=149040 RepID=A0A132BCT8_MOLSC|nr:rhomboid family membrane protein-like protein [Mollisia scopiformis]KUJ10181.1 rhomboid family membrane protein-like protein [Mollisia scopiformis]